jgi:cell division septal protein FtsQ
MSTKREERRKRSELERQNKERQRRRQILRSRLLFALGAAAVIAIGVFLVQRDRPASAGRVWSAEHGHWHDR